MLVGMCVAIECEGIEGKTGVAEPTPPGLGRLPVRVKGYIKWMRWGSIDVAWDESLMQRPGYGPLRFPDGGLVALEHLRTHKWAIYDPKPVRIVASRFEMLYIRGNRIAFPAPAGAFIQGCVARIDDWKRLYVVRVPAPPEADAELLDPHLWPRIV